MEWVVVIAAKGLEAAKSRLADAAGNHRAELAVGMLLDTVAAARAAIGVTAVLVVTEDERIASAVSSIGATSVVEEGRGGLNVAFQQGIKAATLRYPNTGMVLLAGDLPALRSAELESALKAALASPVIVVADHHGTGTTMLAARTPTSLRPAFGVDSFARHVASGAVAVAGALQGLRCDVDTAADLALAVSLGLGPATAAAYDVVVET